MITKLPNSFFVQPDPLEVARALIGKLLVTEFDGILTSGRIVETEAYYGETDRASHAYGGRRTSRTEPLYREGGTAYVYLCYGIHHLFNVVTNRSGHPHCVLIRAIEPVDGLGIMVQRLGKAKADFSIGRGPGNLTRALGIRTDHTGEMLGRTISIFSYDPEPGAILATPRIGVDYAGEDAALPYRFLEAGNRFVSGKQKQNQGKV